MSSSPVIEGKEIWKSFGPEPILRGIDVAIEPGETLAVIGPSGSGKSTLLRCLSLLTPCDSGEVHLQGERVAKGNARGHGWYKREMTRARSRLGVVFQQFNLFPHMSVLANVCEGPRSVLGLDKSARVDRARSNLRLVGLAEREDAMPSELSGGQQQRVGIARALTMEPECLFLDEPTSALDPELVGEMLDLLKDLSTRGLTMMVVTHEMGFAYEASDRVLFLTQGSVVEDGESRRTLSSPRSEELKQFLRRFHLSHAPILQNLDQD